MPQAFAITPMSKTVLAWIVAVALVAAGSLWWWQSLQGDTASAPAPSTEAPPTAPPPSMAEVASTPDPMASAPLEAPASAPRTAVLPPLPSDDAGMRQSLAELVGREAALKLLQTDAFAERMVATLDNLTRNHAAPRLWPVHPVEGRFEVDDQGRIAIDNGERYTALVQMAERVPPATAADYFRRLEPQLQAAYANLGYPNRNVRTRVLEVIDHLLATPTPKPPVAVTLTDVKGPIPSERPWVRYEYADPALESRSAGQKMLMRVGEVNQRRLMAWLRAVRAELAR